MDWADDSDVQRRFEAKYEIDEGTGCWEWTAGIGSHGYGAFGITHDDVQLAHRVSYALENGGLPEDGVLRHRCDNPRCVNPDHLVPGTQSDNLNDAIERGHYEVGEARPGAELTELDVRDIRERYAEGSETQAEIASDYPISQQTVSDIVNMRLWAHVD